MPELSAEIELAKYRIEKAVEDLSTAKENLANNKLRAANKKPNYRSAMQKPS